MTHGSRALAGHVRREACSQSRSRAARVLFGVVLAAVPLVAVVIALRSRVPADLHGDEDVPGTVFRTTVVGEPDARDQLRTRPVRAWSRRSLSGIWCRIPIGADVRVVAIDRSPVLVFEVIAPDGGCRGWVDARLTSDGVIAER